MAHRLTKDRARFIEEDLGDRFSVMGDGTQPDDWFEVMTYPWEVHYFVSRFNWDYDLAVLNWIVDMPLCDKATALMVFWRAAPSYYTRYATQGEADAAYNGDVYELIKKLISNWESGFYINQQIAYDPFADDAYEVNAQKPNAKWSIPDSLRVVLLGEEIAIEG